MHGLVPRIHPLGWGKDAIGLSRRSDGPAGQARGRAPLRKTSVSRSAKVSGWENWKTLVSVTAYHSLYGSEDVNLSASALSCSVTIVYRADRQYESATPAYRQVAIRAGRSEGSSPFGARHRATTLYPVDPSGSAP